MAFMGVREQVLANCKFLYGADIEVITQKNGSENQAAAVRFNRSTGNLSVLLWSDLTVGGTTFQAIADLLQMSETEIAKRCSKDGVFVPFEGKYQASSNHGLSMTLHHKIVGDTGTATNVMSEESSSSFSDTPASSIAGANNITEESFVYNHEEPQSAGVPEEARNEEAKEYMSRPDLRLTDIEPEFHGHPASESTLSPEFQPEPKPEHLTRAAHFDEWGFGANNKANNDATAADNNLVNELVADVRLENQERNAEITDDDSAWAKWKPTWTMTTEEFHSSYLSEEGRKKNVKKVTISPAPEPETVSERQAVGEECGIIPGSDNKVVDVPLEEGQAKPQEYQADVAEEDFGFGTFKQSKEEIDDYLRPNPTTKTNGFVGGFEWSAWGQNTVTKEAQNTETKSSATKPILMATLVDTVEAPKSESAVVSVPDVPISSEPEPDQVCEDLDWGFAPKESKKKGKMVVTEDLTADSATIPDSRAVAIVEDDFRFGFSGTLCQPSAEDNSGPDYWFKSSCSKGKKRSSSREGKKQKAKLALDDNPAAESAKEPKSQEPEFPKDIAIEDDGWGFSRTKRERKKKAKQAVAEDLVQEPEPQPEASIDDGWGAFVSKKDKKKKGKKVVVEGPPPEPEAERVPEVDVWDFSRMKKDKRKKSKKLFIEEPLVEEPVEAPLIDEHPTEEPHIEELPVEESAYEAVEAVEAVPSEIPAYEAVEEVSIEEPIDELSVEPPIEELPIEEPPLSVPEPEPEPIFEELNWGSLSGKKQKYKKNFTETWQPNLEPEPEPEVELERELEKAIETHGWGTFAAEEDKEIVPEAPVPDAEPAPTVDDGWGGFGWGSFATKKDKKKGKKKGIVASPDPINEVPPPELEVIPEPEPEMDPEPQADEFGWGSFATSKKNKKKKNVFELEPEIIPSSEPEAVVDEFGWGSFATSKKDKKKSKVMIDDITPVPEDPLHEPEPEAVVDEFGWGSFSTSKKDKKGKTKKKTTVFDDSPVLGDPVAAPEPEPENIPDPEPAEPVTDDFGWGSFSSSKKDKNKKKTSMELPIPEQQEQEPLSACSAPEVAEDIWAVRPNSKKKKMKASLEPEAAEPEPTGVFSKPEEEAVPKNCDDSTEKAEPCEEPKEVPPAPPKTNPFAKNDIRIPHGRTVILKILRRDVRGNEKTLRAMLKLFENTGQGILDSTGAYLRMTSPSRHELRISRGVGPDGELDLLGLEDDMWEEYLEYFSQFSKFPELTIEAVEVANE